MSTVVLHYWVDHPPLLEGPENTASPKLLNFRNMCTQACQEGTHACQEWTQAFLTCIKEYKHLNGSELASNHNWYLFKHIQVLGEWRSLWNFSCHSQFTSSLRQALSATICNSLWQVWSFWIKLFLEGKTKNPNNKGPRRIPQLPSNACCSDACEFSHLHSSVRGDASILPKLNKKKQFFSDWFSSFSWRKGYKA